MRQEGNKCAGFHKTPSPRVPRFEEIRQPKHKPSGGTKRGGEEEQKDHLGASIRWPEKEIQAGDEDAAESKEREKSFGFEEENGEDMPLNIT